MLGPRRHELHTRCVGVSVIADPVLLLAIGCLAKALVDNGVLEFNEAIFAQWLTGFGISQQLGEPSCPIWTGTLAFDFKGIMRFLQIQVFGGPMKESGIVLLQL